MKIAVNLFLASPRSETGVFVYIREILTALLHADTENTFYLFGSQETISYFKSLYKDVPNVRFRTSGIKRDLLTNPVRAVKKLVAKVRRDYRTNENIIAEEIGSYMRRENIGLYFSPSQTIFPRDPGSVKIIATIHDLQHEYFPEYFSPNYLAQRKEDCRYAVGRSAHLIAISEYTKRSLVEKYGAAPEKVSVIYHAPKEIETGTAIVAIPQKFVFYLAALWPHKNHRVLIKALGILKDRFPSLCAVCAGVIKSKDLKKDLELAAESEGLKERILFLGHVSDEDLRSIYNQAMAFVFPSAFEGFGIPLIEAFQAGLPVIAADNSSIPEVVGDAGILVPTGSAEALAEAIEQVLTNTTLRDSLIMKGYERAKLFSWEKAARETLAVFSSLGAK